MVSTASCILSSYGTFWGGYRPSRTAVGRALQVVELVPSGFSLWELLKEGLKKFALPPTAALGRQRATWHLGCVVKPLQHIGILFSSSKFAPYPTWHPRRLPRSPIWTGLLWNHLFGNGVCKETPPFGPAKPRSEAGGGE